MQRNEEKTKGARKRAQILRTGRSLLIDRGHDSFSVREVATKLDMKLGHIQYYFRTKDDLLEALVREELNSNLQEIRTIANKFEAIGQSLEMVVRNLLAVWRLEGAKIYMIMPFRALYDEKYRVLSEEIYSAFFAAIGEVLKNADSTDSPEQLATKAQMITAVMDGALLQSNPDQNFEDDVVATVQLIASHKGL